MLIHYWGQRTRWTRCSENTPARTYVRIYVEKNWSVGPTGPLHSCTAAQLFLRLTHARVHIIILEFN
jgi:hypothetical protein